MTYFCLDMARRNWRFTPDNTTFKRVFACLDRRAVAARAVLETAGAPQGDSGDGRQSRARAGRHRWSFCISSTGRRWASSARAPAAHAVLVITAAVRHGPGRQRSSGDAQMIDARVTRGRRHRASSASAWSPCIRLTDASVGRDVARALADGGVTALEVTMTVPRRGRADRELARRRCRPRASSAPAPWSIAATAARSDRSGRAVRRGSGAAPRRDRGLPRARRGRDARLFHADRDPRRPGMPARTS